MASTETSTDTQTIAPGGSFMVTTGDITGRVTTIDILTDGDCQVGITNSEDSGSTYDDLGDSYRVNTTSDLSSVWADGLIRATVTSNQASGNQEVTVVIKAYSVGTSSYVSPEDVWRTAGVNRGVVARGDVMWFIERAIAEVELMTERKYESTSITETYVGDNTNELFLDHHPILTLTTLTINGTSITPDYVDKWLNIGKLILTDEAEESKFIQNQLGERTTSVTYTYGTSTVPVYIKRLTECLTALMVLTYQTGGTYDDVTSYSMGGLEASVGEPWVNINATVKYIEKEVDRLMSHIRKQPHIA